MKKTTVLVIVCLFAILGKAQMADSSQMMIDEIEKSLTYKTGIIELAAG